MFEVKVDSFPSKRTIQQKNYLFWPDLASAHYSNDAKDVYVKYGVNVLPKSSNPPNVPQLRPIEDFFGILRLKVFKDGFKPKSTDELKEKDCIRDQKVTKEVLPQSHE